MKKTKLHWCWSVLAILMSVSIAASVCFGILYWQRMDQKLLNWRNDCEDSGGVWYERILNGYNEYVCRINGD